MMATTTQLPRRAALVVAAMVVAFACTSALGATLNTRPVPINGASLQAYFDFVGQTINVNTDQEGNALWTTTVSGNSTFTLQLELTGNASQNAVGIYNDGAPGTLFQIFPGNAAPGWFAIASFDVGIPGRVVVNLFDDNAVLQSSTSYLGVNSGDFGFYLSNATGATYYSEDDENAGGAPQNVVYAATGTSKGSWWLAWEDSSYSTGDRDFDDLVMFLESVNLPSPVQATSWGAIKSLYKR
jgi:hypothetical protein